MFPDILLICDQPIFRVSATNAVVSASSNHKHYKGLSLCFRKSCGLGFSFQFHTFRSIAGISGRAADEKVNFQGSRYCEQAVLGWWAAVGCCTTAGQQAVAKAPLRGSSRALK